MSYAQNVRRKVLPICKYFLKGYCRNQSKCHQPHKSNICEEKVCRDPYCREKPTNNGKYYAREGECTNEYN